MPLFLFSREKQACHEAVQKQGNVSRNNLKNCQKMKDNG